MENQPFDLNAAIQHWRKELAKSSSFRPDDLDELESHLRDSVSSLQAQGLTLDEAFLIARRRTGPKDVLAAEFATINGSSVWMEKISGEAAQPLKWVQPSGLKLEYELLAGETEAATLKFRSCWGTLARAESADGCWTFKRNGFWQTRASIRMCGANTDLAVFQNNTWTGGGTLTFTAGARYKATTNLWMTNYEIRTENDEPLVRFNYGGLFRLSAQVEIQSAAKGLADLPLLVLFGWYLAVMCYMDASVAGAAGAGGTS